MQTAFTFFDSETFAFIDLETTGGHAGVDRITEIGLRLWRDGEVIEEWQTLVNPETRISSFIEHFTGISNAMVADAPLFADVAQTLAEKLKGAIFVAHNARFDYGFVKAEFRRLEQAFSAPVLCTVKLSRALYPEFRHHNMDALIERHSLISGPRHRAMGDVESMLAFFQHARDDKGDEAVTRAIRHLLKRPSLPSHLDAEVIDQLPRGHGVYRFYGENDVLLYVGKSNNIAQRVMSHFSDDHRSGKALRISQSLRRIEWTETAGELGALLLELQQIKTLNPLYNRRSRMARKLVSLRLEPNEAGYLQVSLTRDIDPSNLDDYYGLFRSKGEAQRALMEIARGNELCNRLLDLEPPVRGPCFRRQLGGCNGACEGQEDVTRYNLRAQLAFYRLRLRTWPWSGAIGIVESDHRRGLKEILVIYNWVPVTTLRSEEGFQDLDLSGRTVSLDLDSYRLIVKALMDKRGSRRLIELPQAGAPTVIIE